MDAQEKLRQTVERGFLVGSTRALDKAMRFGLWIGIWIGFALGFFAGASVVIWYTP